MEDNSADAERLAHLKTRRFVDLVRSAEMLAKQRNGNFGYAEKKIFNAICRTTGDEREYRLVASTSSGEEAKIDGI
ncbi:MAG: hypothetical protein JO110_08030 [Acetobacteraceae bacterium]|nr:hypothetical protein [Acetobacteraceae bacterium]